MVNVLQGLDTEMMPGRRLHSGCLDGEVFAIIIDLNNVNIPMLQMPSKLY